jgi:hypothetical protein
LKAGMAVLEAGGTVWHLGRGGAASGACQIH